MSITIAINFILASAYNFAHVVMIVSRELQNIWRKGKHKHQTEIERQFKLICINKTAKNLHIACVCFYRLI